MFLWTLWKKRQVDKNGCKCILFRIDAYFNKFLLAVETDEKGHSDRDLIFEEKRQEALEQKIGCKFFRINTSNAKNSYDLNYEVGNISFIDEFKNKKNKTPRKKINRRKRNERENRERNEKEHRKKMREKTEKEL